MKKKSNMIHSFFKLFICTGLYGRIISTRFIVGWWRWAMMVQMRVWPMRHNILIGPYQMRVSLILEYNWPIDNTFVVGHLSPVRGRTIWWCHPDKLVKLGTWTLMVKVIGSWWGWSHHQLVGTAWTTAEGVVGLITMTKTAEFVANDKCTQDKD